MFDDEVNAVTDSWDDPDLTIDVDGAADADVAVPAIAIVDRTIIAAAL